MSVRAEGSRLAMKCCVFFRSSSCFSSNGIVFFSYSTSRGVISMT